jgi:hypothetical protein
VGETLEIAQVKQQRTQLLTRDRDEGKIITLDSELNDLESGL